MFLLLVACVPSSPVVPSEPLPTGGDRSPGWYTLDPLPVPLQEVAVVSRRDGSVWVMGGFDDTVTVREEIWILDETFTWTAGPTLPAPLHHVNAAEVNGDLYILGALEGRSFNPRASAWRLPEGGLEWEPLGDLPEAIGASAVGVVGNAVVLVGGTTAGSSASTWLFDVSSETWSAGPDLPAVRDHGNASGGASLLATAGRANGLGNVRGDTWELNGDVWTARAALPTPRAGAAAATLPDGRWVVIGGEGSGSVDGTFLEVEVYDRSTDAWTRGPDLPVGLHGTGAAPFDGGVVVPGGATVQAFRATEAVQFLVF